MSEKIRFVADAMLGTLAKRLRWLGFDTLYQPGIEDEKLIQLALQDRILLTRDTELTRRINSMNRKQDSHIRYIFIIGDKVNEQLEHLSSELGVAIRMQRKSRCTICNTMLRQVKPHEVAGLVPEYILSVHRQFYLCDNCNKAYWKGSHFERFIGSLPDEVK